MPTSSMNIRWSITSAVRMVSMRMINAFTCAEGTWVTALGNLRLMRKNVNVRRMKATKC